MFPGNFLLFFLIFFSFFTIRFFATIADFNIRIIMLLAEMNTSFFFLAAPCSKQDLSSPNRERNFSPYVGSVES